MLHWFLLDYRVLIRLIDDFLLLTPHLMKARTFLRYAIRDIVFKAVNIITFYVILFHLDRDFMSYQSRAVLESLVVVCAWEES